ncbi:MAG TPA: iron ABC transporter permease [Stellaceae bacterium]|nr:iron ABC transporter permease [Stellaceae bacterium]
MTRASVLWLSLGGIAIALLPWYGLEGDGLLSSDWLRSYPDASTGPALYQIAAAGRSWLLLPVLPWLGLAGVAATRGERAFVTWAGLGMTLLLVEGFAIIHSGPAWPWLAALLSSDAKQPGLGYGGALLGLSYLMLGSRGFAARGFCKGDAFTVSAIALVVSLIALFVFFPILTMLASAGQNNNGAWAPSVFIDKLLSAAIWGVGCIARGVSCGVAWNTIFLAIVAGAGATALGLAFALLTVRTGFQWKRLLRLLTILPIITPPFVIGLAIILLFGRAGAITALLSDWFDIPRSRWVYGLPGVLLAQLLAFAPIAFMVLIGVVQGVAPSLEEASETLGASRWTSFRRVTWPLIRPGVANAFLLGFVESMADFGNPLVLGGNYEVLSTKVFFAVVGASHDQGQAAVLAIVLLAFTLGAFYAQHRWLGRRVYTTVTGKGDSGLPIPLPTGVRAACYGVAALWTLLTLAIYATILLGGFVRALGRDYTFTFDHYLTGFSAEWGPRGLLLTGSAWDSLWTTLGVSAVSAPLTAAIGLVTAYLLTRQRFAGQRLFEFGTMLSFAIPGTVVGVSYILAFNVPPVELTGTALILVICFVFRNMPVGVRAGMAMLAQIDQSLDEASLTLGARTGTTLRRVVLPLLKPAMVTALVYSFVRAMTAVSAVIFLVSAQHNMATAYIVGRAEAGEFGLAIAYSSALIVIMLAAIALIQLLVGERRLGRRALGAGELAIEGAG